MKHQLIKIILTLFIINNIAYSAEHHTKEWAVSTIIGSFSQNPKIKYYIEPQIRLIDNEYVFNQSLFLTGLGYQPTPHIMVFAGPAWVVTKNTNGETYQEYRGWQQLNWQMINKSTLLLNSRTRLEEKARNNQSQIAIQLRQRLWTRIPIKNTNKYYYSLFDEVFFNINHPSWTSPYFFEQNRAFLGIGKELTKNTIIDFGYLNQFQFGPPRQINNVFWLSFSMTS